MPRYWKLYFFLLLLTVLSVWIAALSISSSKLKIVACDVGQGDATLLTYKTTQILVDAGPGRKVLDCLSRHVPFWDRTIELVMISHPQVDHFGGLINIYEHYDVQDLMTTGLNSGSKEWQVLENRVAIEGTKVHRVVGGQRYRVGLIYLDIVHPDTSFLSQKVERKLGENKLDDSKVLGAFDSKIDPNLFSIVAILSFGEFDVLMTGDIDPKISDMVADRLEKHKEKSIDYIKIPHHGSKNGMTSKLLDSIDPDVAVISAGKNNSYGHPHGEILQILADHSIPVLRTDLVGEIVLESDGVKFEIK